MNKTKIKAVVGLLIFATVLTLVLVGPFTKDNNDTNSEKENSQSSQMTKAENKKYSELVSSLHGSCWSNNDNGIKTVIIFSDYDEEKNYQQIITLSNYQDNPTAAYDNYQISNDMKQLIYDPGADNMKRPFSMGKNYIEINGTKYVKDDINNYSN